MKQPSHPSTMIIPIHQYPIPYRNESIQKPPQYLRKQHQCSAQQLLQHAHNNVATLWQGDYHQAKQLLNAIKKRLHKPFQAATNAYDTFHQYRLYQSQRSRLINMLLIQIDTYYELNLPRSPKIKDILEHIYGHEHTHPFLLPLNQLLGFIGAYEWYQKGINIPYLPRPIHVPFGVFAPMRNEYLDLVMQAALPKQIHTAFDIGTGSGILALLLAKRGITHIIATDNNPRAVQAAIQNSQQQGYQQHISVIETEYFPAQTADLIICNPPWLPAKPTSSIETAIYDFKHQMLKTLLHQAKNHLNSHGQFWLIMSNLAEHLGLRQTDTLKQWIAEAGWHIKQQLSTQPKHPKAHMPNNPLAFARQQEITSLYILEPYE